MFPITEIMTKDVITAKEDTPIMDIIQILVDKKITGIPIVNQENKLVGILSEFDVLRLLFESEVTATQTAKDFMTRAVIAFSDDVTAIEVCEFFIANPSKRRLPIVHEGKLVGLVSRADIVKLIKKLRHIKGNS